MVSVREKRAFTGHLSSSSCATDRKTKMQTRNKYRMHVFFKEFLFLHCFCSSIVVFQLSVRTDRVREVVEQKADRHGQGEGG